MSSRFDSKKYLQKAKKKMQKELASPDHILVQSVNAVEDLTKISNLAYERLCEWYGIHFPEFRHSDPEKYAQVALNFNRAKPDKKKLMELLPQKGDSILHKANNSSGVIFSKEDMEALQKHAKLTLDMFAKRDEIEKYTGELAKKLAPNTSLLAGEHLAAKLIAHAGSIKKLAAMPGSTIQVLGAEKALFKHLRSGSPSPKHGLIFQHPLISQSPKGVRGKISRALASKIAIAVKADCYSHHNIAQELKKKFDARANDILNKAKSSKKKRR